MRIADPRTETQRPQLSPKNRWMTDGEVGTDQFFHGDHIPWTEGRGILKCGTVNHNPQVLIVSHYQWLLCPVYLTSNCLVGVSSVAGRIPQRRGFIGKSPYK